MSYGCHYEGKIFEITLSLNQQKRGLWTQSSQQELGCPEEAS